MAIQIQMRGDTTDAHKEFIGANREVTVDTDKRTLVVHDGITKAGFPLARENLENVLLENLLNKGLLSTKLTNITEEGLSVIKSYIKDNISEIIVIKSDVSIIVGSPANSLDGYLKCDGSAISRTIFKELFDKIGTIYGIGDGKSTFNIPDYRGCFLRGYLEGRSNTIGILQKDGLPGIVGQIQTNPYVTSPANSSGALSSFSASGSMKNYVQSSSGNISTSGWIQFNAANSNGTYGASNYVTPYNHAINWFIKY